MLKTIDMISGAVNEANWIVVNQQLQQLIDKKNTNSQNVGEDILEQAVNIAIQVLEAGDFQTKWDVAKIFPKIGDKAIFALIKILEDETTNIEVRWFALRILGEFNHPEVIIALVKILEETDEEELAIASAQALAKIGRNAIEPMIELLKEQKSRLLAVKSLAQIRHSEVIEPLLSIVDDFSAEVRVIVIEALGSFHQQRLIPIFIKALEDTSTKVRKEAIIALKMRVKELSEFDLVNHLKPLIYDTNLEVSQQAIFALGCINNQDSMQALFGVLNSKNINNSIKKEAARALNWSGNAVALNYLEESIYLSNITLCQEIIAVLGRQETVDLKFYAAKILIDFFNSGQELLKQSQIRQVLATSFGELADSAARNYLEKLTIDDDSKVRLHAKAAIKKLNNRYK